MSAAGPYNPMDLGLDLDHAKALPECAACRKKSDGAKAAGTVFLCGTHYAEWFRSSEYDAFRAGAFGEAGSFCAFVARLRRERYAACWTSDLGKE